MPERDGASDGNGSSGVASPSVEERVLAERVGMIIAQTPQGLAGPAALAVIGAVVLWDRAAPWPLVATLVALFAVLASWLGFYLRHRRVRAEPREGQRWLRGMQWRTAAHGTAWGAYSLIAFQRDSVLHQSVDVAFMYGMVAGAVVVDGPHFPTFVRFALPTLLPVIVRCFVEGTPASIAVGSAGLVGLGHGLFAALNASRLTEASVRARLRNLDLLHELERQRELAEQARRAAEAANREKSRFLAAASHDLRQPVHALGLLASAAERAATDAERQRIVAQMATSIGSLSALFDALLEASRLDAGILQPELTPVGLAPLLAKLVTELEPEARQKGLSLRARVRNVTVLTDAMLCERLVRNLLANALAYTERGGVLVAVRLREGRARVEVWDTGVGIAAAELGAIFEPFYQVGNPERDRRRGVGLGLSIVQGLAALLAHRVEVVSRPGRGSRFSVELPLVAEARVAERSRASTAPAPVDETGLLGAIVVVIDDEPEVRTALEVVLRQAGCRVVASESAERAREELARLELQPDAVLSDFRLRGSETGLAAVSRLRGTYGRDLPALLITGDAAGTGLTDAVRSELPTLHKPVRPDALKRALLDLLQNRPIA